MKKTVFKDDDKKEMRGVGDGDGEERKKGSEDGEMKRVEMEDENGFSGEDEDKLSLIPSSSSEMDENGVVREYEVALKHLGFGFFHFIILIINGVALSSVWVMVNSTSFILPVLSRKDEWGLVSAKEAILGSTIFVGELLGGFVWGSVADIIGRRTVNILTLLINGIFCFFSAFLPWFWIFVFFRLLCGFGAVGVFPVPYMSEFIRNKYRGPYLGVLTFFWTMGELISIALAWAIIPIKQFDLFGHEIDSWRVYAAICALPSIVGAVLYCFLPESPRFLLQVGKHEKALKTLRLVHRLNHFRKYVEYPVKFIFLDDVESDPTSKLRTAGDFCKEVLLKNVDLFRLKFLRQTVLLMTIMFCLSLGNLGTLIWYPTYVSQLTAKKNVDNLQTFCSKTSFSSTDEMISYCGCSSSVFQDSTFSLPQLKNWRINDVLFRNVTFLDVDFDSVLFNGTEFIECKFQNSIFTKVFFNATNFNNVRFQSVNILPTSLCLFSNESNGAVTLENVTLNNRMVESQYINISNWYTIFKSEANIMCNDDQYENVKCKSVDFSVYRDSIIIAVSIFPGAIVAAFATYFFRRNYWLAFTMFVSAVSVFLLYIVISEIYVVAMLSLFNAVSTPIWNNLSLIIAELYPTHLRSTASGLHRLVAMIGAIIGANVFGLFVKDNPRIPILLIASFFFVGTVCSLGLPTTTRKTLLK